MKRLSYFLIGAVALGMVSCSQDDVIDNAAGDGYAITVKLPADKGATRAISDGYTAIDLHMAVYDMNTNALVTTMEGNFEPTSLETTVHLSLAKGKSYKIAFFAQSPESEDVYEFDATNKVINVYYENMLSDNNLNDDYDCFYQIHSTGVISSESMGTTVVLYRPIAQINWGTNDYDEIAVKDDNAYGPNGTYLRSSLTLNAYNTLDLLTGDVTGTPVESTIKGLAAPIDEPFPVYEAKAIYNDEGEEVGEENAYKYLAMQYVLAPKDVELFKLNLDVNNAENPNVGAGATNDVIVVDNAPLQANYRTNIYGALLTNPLDYKVVKDPNWFKPDYDINVNWDGKTVTFPSQNPDGSYTAYSASDLAGLAEMVNGGNDFAGKTVYLSTDVDMGGYDFPGIGSFTGDVDENTLAVTGNAFKGMFDGNGHTISNVSIAYDAENGGAAAFFANVSGNTSGVQNVNFANVNITGESDVAGVIGIASSGASIEKVTVTGNVEGRQNTAGIVGILFNASIQNSDNSANVTGSFRNTGGVIGATAGSNAMATECNNSGAISGGWQVGGICGVNTGTIQQCNNTGTVTGANNSVGGVVGETRMSGQVLNNTNSASVTSPDNSYGTGGIVGWIRYIAGFNTGTGSLIVVSGNNNSGNVSGGNGVAGVVGTWYWGGLCRNNVNSAAAVNGVSNVAGVVGFAFQAGGNTVPSTAQTLTLNGNTNSTEKFTGTPNNPIINNGNANGAGVVMN